MRKIFKWIGICCVIIGVVIAGLAFWKREEVARLGAVLTLFSEDKIVNNFSHMDEAFLSVSLGGKDGPVSPLPLGAPLTLSTEAQKWVEDRSVTGLVILKDGELVFENYYKGTAANDLRINWSLSKSYLSVLFGVLLEEGLIDSIDSPVIQYAPSLTETPYKDASIKDVLQMSSGLLFDEDYLDFFSDINKMGRTLALGGSMDAFAANQVNSYAAPGEVWKYCSIDTHVLGMIIRGATGLDIPSLLAEKVTGPLGLEVAPYYLTDGFGVSFVLGGLNITTRDNARFGQMVANGGQWNGKQIVSADWIAASTTASAKTEPGKIGYGYQWWMPVGYAPGQILARGVYGQYLFIDRVNNVVISVHGADKNFRDDGVQAYNNKMLLQIAESLN